MSTNDDDLFETPEPTPDRVIQAEAVYEVAERFFALQGEGLHTGVSMAFVRFVGCSVGKKICSACDTDFERQHPWQGGGLFSAKDLRDWMGYPYRPLCLTGGEPFDQHLDPIFKAFEYRKIHIETSGTKPIPDCVKNHSFQQAWVTCSPKPGFLEEVVLAADEVKVLVPGLGAGPGWPTLADAIRWANARTDGTVFLQPRNAKRAIDPTNLALVQEVIREHPELRLSLQLHKLLASR